MSFQRPNPESFMCKMWHAQAMAKKAGLKMAGVMHLFICRVSLSPLSVTAALCDSLALEKGGCHRGIQQYRYPPVSSPSPRTVEIAPLLTTANLCQLTFDWICTSYSWNHYLHDFIHLKDKVWPIRRCSIQVTCGEWRIQIRFAEMKCKHFFMEMNFF